MFYFKNYEVLIANSNIMKGVINDEKIDMISEFLPRCM